MTLAPAPFHAQAADGPEGGQAFWVKTDDGLRLRVGLFPARNARGTVLLMPGRTEYVEKYGRTAADLAKSGLGVLAIDWRGQGLADRLLDDGMIGHVRRFADYQRDVAAMVEAAKALDLPRPWHLLAHSMGGCIGLRALHEGLEVETVCFSAPMWGINMSKLTRPVAWSVAAVMSAIGLTEGLTPGTKRDSFVATEPFATNTLTGDEEMYDYMRAHLELEPGFGLGGPSVNWLFEALKETRALAAQPAPRQPCLTWLGTREIIVDAGRIHAIMGKWPSGKLELIEGAQHEVLMEMPEIRDRVMARTAAHFTTRTELA